MKKFLITHNVCGEIRMDVVEANVDTLKKFTGWIIEGIGIGLHFIILPAVYGDTKVDIAIKPQNIEAITEFND